VAGNHCSFGKNILLFILNGQWFYRAHIIGPARRLHALWPDGGPALAFQVEMLYAWLIPAAITSGYWKQLTKTGQDGHLEDGKGNLTMINTGESAHIAVGGFTGVATGSTEMRAARIICPISLLTGMGIRAGAVHAAL
jgi:hypothetical protein